MSRAFTANLAHAAFTGGAAFFIGLARLHYRHGIPLALLGIGLAVVFHGAYDLFLFSLPRWNLVSLLLVLPLAIALLGLRIRWAQGQQSRRAETSAKHPKTRQQIA